MIPTSQPSPAPPSREPLLAWYRGRERAYPWRVDPTPYRVLVSEIMLQQTQATRAAEAFGRFVRRFPTPRSLAAAPRSEVLRAWAGLGYNRRAVALSETARQIVRGHRGRVPSEPEDLMGLPGIGPYTAAAVASIAFGAPVAAIDTNVRRVISRAVLGRDDALSSEVASAAAAWLDPADPGRWNQALMDLGREICRPRPACERCPLRTTCRSVRTGSPVGPPAGRRQGRFEGSTRQARGAVVRALRVRSVGTIAWIRDETGLEIDRVRAAVRALVADGVLAASPGALEGSPRGRVRLSA